jgi:hypothetical protein
MAQAQSVYFFWLERAMTRASMGRVNDKRLEEEGSWQAPRITDAEAVEQATLILK